MKRTIKTIEELQWAEENDPELVQRYLSKVTVDEDLHTHLRWLHDNEVTTTIEANLNRYKNRSLGIHPSSASKKGVCQLKIYYECTGEIPPNRKFDPVMQQTWDVGTMLHELYQAHFKAIYRDQFEPEVKLVNEAMHIKSRTDGIFDFESYRIVLEAKSIKEGGNYGWAKVQDKPMEDNVRQAHFYMKLANVPFGLIFYMNKNAGEWKEHAITFDQGIWDDILTKVIEPVGAAAFGEGGDIEGKPTWYCRWCDYAYDCPAKKGEEDDIQW